MSIESINSPGAVGRRTPVQAVIFDLDGLLVDTEDLWSTAIGAALAAYGIQFDRDACAETIGAPLAVTLAWWARRYPILAGVGDELPARVYAAMLDLVRAAVRPMPGARDALAAVRGSGLPIGLASGSPRQIIAAVLTRLGWHGVFQVVRSADTLAAGKPAPDVYLACAGRLGVAPARCLAVEDSVPGLRAADAAGMRTVAVRADPSGYQRWGVRPVAATDTLSQVDWSALLEAGGR